MTIPETVSKLFRPELEVVIAMRVMCNSGATGFFRIKRGAELLDAMLEPEFHAIKVKFKANNHFVTDELLACAMLLVARLSENSGNTPLAKKLGILKYSSLRFASLIRCEDYAELFTHLQRAVRFCEGRVCPFNLTQTVLNWTEARRPATRKKLIADFHEMTPS